MIVSDKAKETLLVTRRANKSFFFPRWTISRRAFAGNSRFEVTWLLLLESDERAGDDCKLLLNELFPVTDAVFWLSMRD